MSTVEQIRKAIDTLTLEQRAELFASYQIFPDDAWDKQMKADIASGKFNGMKRLAQTDKKHGRCLPLLKGLSK